LGPVKHLRKTAFFQARLTTVQLCISVQFQVQKK